MPYKINVSTFNTVFTYVKRIIMKRESLILC